MKALIRIAVILAVIAGGGVAGYVLTLPVGEPTQDFYAQHLTVGSHLVGSYPAKFGNTYYEHTIYKGLENGTIVFVDSYSTGIFELVKHEDYYAWNYHVNMTLQYQSLTFYNVTVEDSGTMVFWTKEDLRFG